MKKTSICVSVVFWLSTVGLSAAQKMKLDEYRAYMQKLDSSTQRWQAQIKGFDIKKMNVDYSTGKMIERARQAVLGNLKLLRTTVQKQGSPKELLSVDIGIEQLLGDASEPLSVMMETFPANGEGVYWTRSLPVVQQEISDTQIRLRTHIDAFADELQAKAEKCSK